MSEDDDAPEIDVQVVRTDEQYEDALDVRFDVFVEGQGVPENLEVDEHEDESVHFVAYLDGEPVGAARLRETDADTAKVERVAVLERFRGDGYGSAVMDRVEDVANERGYDSVSLHAQTHAAPFYDRLDYERVGEEFEEAGIPHVKMVKPL